MSEDAALELRALAALGISLPAATGEGGLDALVQQGAIARHQALAARAWVARNAVACACGRRWLVGDPCPGCGAIPGSAPTRPGSSSVAGRPAALGPGARVGPLLLLEELGRGASGVVFRARHEELGRESALKLISLATHDERRRRRLENELEALARLVHPGIVKVHAVHQLAGTVGVEMELIQGANLAARVARHGPYGWRDAAGLVAGLARAVEHAHRQEVLHRDLKPENVLVRASDGSAVVADFGLSRLRDQASSLTTAGALLGTPMYMAPEAFAGEFTPRSDVYGLGAILYQALSGRPPFGEVESAAALQYRISTGQIDPLRLADAPRELPALVACAMAVDPARRYPSAAALADDLERLLRGERTAISRAGLGPARLAPRALRWVLAGAVGLALLGGGGAALLRWSGADPDRRAPSASGVEGALALFGAPLPSGEERRREAALLRLRAACDPSHPEHGTLVAGLDAAVEAAGAPDPLLALRALLDRARGASLRVTDLAATARAGDAADADALALHASEHETVPPLASPEAREAARALAAAHPRSGGARAFLLVALCAGGDPVARDEVVRLLAEPIPSTATRAHRLASAFAAVAGLTRELETGNNPTDEGAGIAAALSALAADPPLARAPAVCVDPVVHAISRGILTGKLVDITRMGLATAAVRALAAARPALPPASRALEMLTADLLDDDPPWWTRPKPREIQAWGEALSVVLGQEVLGLCVLQIGLRAELERERPADEAGLLRLIELELAVLARVERSPSPETPTAEALWARSQNRIHNDLARLEEAMADLHPEPRRAEHLRRALPHALNALRVTEESGLHWRDSADLVFAVQLAFRAGELAVADELVDRCPEAPALRVELRRRRGDPGTASREARALLTEPLPHPRLRSDLWAILALSLADLGDIPGARAALAELQRASSVADPEVFLWREWAPPAVAAHVEARAAQ